MLYLDIFTLKLHFFDLRTAIAVIFNGVNLIFCRYTEIHLPQKSCYSSSKLFTQINKERT